MYRGCEGDCKSPVAVGVTVHAVAFRVFTDTLAILGDESVMQQEGRVKGVGRELCLA